MSAKGVGSVKAWEADKKKAVFVLAGGFFLLVYSAVLGEVHRRSNPTSVSLAEENAGKVFLAQEQLEYLAQEELEFLQQLESFLAGASIHQAAWQLGQEEKELQKLWNTVEKMGGQEIIYVRDGKPVLQLEGMGLALRKDQVCFYGNFHHGKPEGVCSAIAWPDSEEPGYDYSYSMGLWKDGQMEGLGITGSYSWKPGESKSGAGKFGERETGGGKTDGSKSKEGRAGESRQGVEEQVSGIFLNDRLDGRLTYEQVNAQGSSFWWEITAEGGKTCLDTRWRFLPGLGEYRLLSEKERRGFFVVPENRLEEVWWENRVPWNEEGKP